MASNCGPHSCSIPTTVFLLLTGCCRTVLVNFPSYGKTGATYSVKPPLFTKLTCKHTIRLWHNSTILQELQFQGWVFQEHPFFKILTTYMIHMYIELLIILCLQWVTGKMDEMSTIDGSIIRSTLLCHYVINFLQLSYITFWRKYFSWYRMIHCPAIPFLGYLKNSKVSIPQKYFHITTAKIWSEYRGIDKKQYININIYIYVCYIYIIENSHKEECIYVIYRKIGATGDHIKLIKSFS